MRPQGIRRAGGLQLAGVLLGGCARDAGQAGTVAVGAPAPAYGAPTLEGDSVRLTDLRGEVVLLNLWATWCPPCREEMPGLQALHEEYADQGLRVVGTSIDAASAAPDVRSFVEQHGITFPILHDAQESATRVFRTTGVPETYLIGRDGTLLKRWIGKIDTESAAVRQPIEEALAAEGAR